ncbi:LOW QUALITY PROTEIN: hypothetical protein MAR_013903, partial [Mya arenaria]
MAVVQILNSKSSKSERVMSLVRPIVMWSMQFGVQKCAFSTINAYLSGNLFFLKVKNLQDFTRAFIIQKMLCCLLRNRSVKEPKNPLIIDILKQILRALPSVASSTYKTSLFNEALCIFWFIRIGEIAVDGKAGPYTKVAQISDIVLSECKCSLLIRCSKTDQNGKSVSLIFTHFSKSNICPVLAVKFYLSVRPNTDGTRQNKLLLVLAV